VKTDEGDLEFQQYFVQRKCEPRVKGFRFEGIESAEPAPGVSEAIASAGAILICPSNPWVSIDPILQVISITPTSLPRGKRRRGEGKPVVAISPIIGGQAVKGPAAKMYRELGIEPSALAVANHYSDILTGLVLDNVDRELVKRIEVNTFVTNTMMTSSEDRRRLAQDVLTWMGKL
jgi:LPPG:FO 2-phospho-L-lactate transferase